MFQEISMKNREKADLLIMNAHQIVTCNGQDPESIGIIPNACLAIKGEKIFAVGTKETVSKKVDVENTPKFDATGMIVAPGFVDCHTHLVFGGSRVEEYSARLTISDPEELKRLGIKTGIMVTVDQTRNSSKEVLLDQSEERLGQMLLHGTTTVESKSGYGLSLDSEIKMLEVNKELEKRSPVDIVSTFLGAHGWPADISKNRYMEILQKEMIPVVAERNLASFCDIWCDDGHYTAEESEQILSSAFESGMMPKIHTGAYSYVGGADLAAKMKMVSADHLNYTPGVALDKLVEADVVGVLLPGIDFAVRHPKPFDPKPMIKKGMTLALATNCCPGCWCTNMQFILVLACRNHGMSPASALKAATLGAAKAVNLNVDRGSIEEGKYADIQIWKASCFEDVMYRLGGNLVDTVIKKGKIVVQNGRLKV